MSLFNVAIPKLASGWQNWNLRCSARNCTKRFALQAISGKNQGILLSGNWYCGPDCFEVAAREEAARIMSLETIMPLRRSRMPLGLLLISRGVINAEQLNLALIEHRASGENIGESLTKLGFATPEQITAGVAAQWGCPVFPLSSRYLDTPIRLPEHLRKLCRMLPVHFVESTRKLLVGFVEGVEYGVLDTIEYMTDCVTAPCFISSHEYTNQLQATTAIRQGEEVMFDRIDSPSEVARIVTGYAMQIGGEEARFGMCRNCLWVRLKTERHELDLLFVLNPMRKSSEDWDGGA